MDTSLQKSIQKGVKLKRAKQVNDRSAPMVDKAAEAATKEAGNIAASAVKNELQGNNLKNALPGNPMVAMGGLFAGGFPKLRPTSSGPTNSDQPKVKEGYKPPKLPPRPKESSRTIIDGAESTFKGPVVSNASFKPPSSLKSSNVASKPSAPATSPMGSNTKAAEPRPMLPKPMAALRRAPTSPKKAPPPVPPRLTKPPEIAVPKEDHGPRLSDEAHVESNFLSQVKLRKTNFSFGKDAEPSQCPMESPSTKKVNTAISRLNAGSTNVDGTRNERPTMAVSPSLQSTHHTPTNKLSGKKNEVTIKAESIGSAEQKRPRGKVDDDEEVAVDEFDVPDEPPPSFPPSIGHFPSRPTKSIYIMDPHNY
jgi:hypothetical protein